MRQSENNSLARVKSLSHEEVNNYFHILDSVFTKNNLLNKPSCIFNVDETGLQLNCLAEEAIAYCIKRLKGLWIVIRNNNCYRML